MKNITRFLIVLIVVLLFSTSCFDSLLQTYVRFENRSGTKTVNAIWDGSIAATLAPGEITEYREVNPGSHTMMWDNALNSKALSSLSWPNLVAGHYYTHSYSDQ